MIFTVMDNGMDRPPAWNFQEGVDGKLKSNLQWPYCAVLIIGPGKGSKQSLINKNSELLLPTRMINKSGVFIYMASGKLTPAWRSGFRLLYSAAVGQQSFLL